MWVKIKTLPRTPPNAGQEEKGGEVVEAQVRGEMLCIHFRGGGLRGKTTSNRFPIKG